MGKGKVCMILDPAKVTPEFSRFYGQTMLKKDILQNIKTYFEHHFLL